MVMREFIHFVRNSIGQFLQRRDLQYLFLFAFILRLSYMMLMLGQLPLQDLMSLCPDSIRYTDLGERLLHFGIVDESTVLIFGPGYGVFLAAVFLVVGPSPIMVVLIQILLSSLSCLMIYRLGRELIGSKAVGYIAAMLSALSFTSVSLATILLSDTLFFFLFLWGNLAFILGSKNGQRPYFIFSGIFVGLAALTRTIGQFWPLLMIALIFVLCSRRPRQWKSFAGKVTYRRAFWAPGIAMVIMLLWMGRNYVVHDTPMLAFTGAGGPANVAIMTVSEIEDVEPGEVIAGWQRKHMPEKSIADMTYAERYRVYSAGTWDVLRKYPGGMINTYRHLVWLNLHEMNELYRLQLPRQANEILSVIYRLRIQNVHYYCFWLSVAGLVALIVMRRWRAFLFLGLLYGYFAAMIGFTRWQGSRLFYPGQIAWSILIAALVVGIVTLICRYYERIRSKQVGG